MVEPAPLRGRGTPGVRVAADRDPPCAPLRLVRRSLGSIVPRWVAPGTLAWRSRRSRMRQASARRGQASEQRASATMPEPPVRTHAAWQLTLVAKSSATSTRMLASGSVVASARRWLSSASSARSGRRPRGSPRGGRSPRRARSTTPGPDRSDRPPSRSAHAARCRPARLRASRADPACPSSFESNGGFKGWSHRFGE